MVRSANLLEGRGDRGDLHAGIPTCDYENFAIKIWESVGMETHVESEYLCQLCEVVLLRNK